MENDNTIDIKKSDPVLKPLILSDDFKKILNKILSRGVSKISTKLLNMEKDKEHMFNLTYIDRTDRDDFITYIQSSRINRYDEGTDIWKVKGRIETRIGRLIRRIFGTKFNQVSVDNFVNKYKATVRSELDNHFELVSGNDISYWYHYSKYNETRGSLGGSCMQGDECQKYFKIYTNNPNQVKLCILKENKDSDKIKGRALIWNISNPEGLIFMDRIYTNDDADSNLFLEYAKKNGWVTKKKQNYNNDTVILPDGTKTKYKLSVELDDNDFNRYPYMDTFKFFNKENKTLYNNDNKIGKHITLVDTDGRYDEYDYDEPTYVTDWEGNEISENDAVWCQFDNEYCLRTDATRVSKGETGRGKFFIPNSKFLSYSPISKSYYHIDDVVYSKHLSCMIYKKYVVNVYLDKERNNSLVTHRLQLHKTIGKIGDEYFILDILEKEADNEKKYKIKD